MVPSDTQLEPGTICRDRRDASSREGTVTIMKAPNKFEDAPMSRYAVLETPLGFSVCGEGRPTIHVTRVRYTFQVTGDVVFRSYSQAVPDEAGNLSHYAFTESGEFYGSTGLYDWKLRATL